MCYNRLRCRTQKLDAIKETGESHNMTILMGHKMVPVDQPVWVANRCSVQVVSGPARAADRCAVQVLSEPARVADRCAVQVVSGPARVADRCTAQVVPAPVAGES